MKYLLILMFAICASLVNGQVITTVGQGQDIFQRNLYSADRVMELRKELELTDAQATKIKKIHSENAGKFSTMKWDLDDATEKLKELLDESRIDEVAVQKQMDKVLALENALKKQQLSTMVSIKNELSFAQQEILQTPNVRRVNGVSISGYGSSSFKTEPFYLKNYGEGKLGVAVKGSSSKPKVAVKIAGTSNSDNAPLYYIDTKDGLKQIKDFNNIDPEDIASIEVLKDKSAIDVVGEKGENGVIIIKLKKDPKK